MSRLRIVERSTGRDDDPPQHASDDGAHPLCLPLSQVFHEVTFPPSRHAILADVNCGRCRRILLARLVTR